MNDNSTKDEQCKILKFKSAETLCLTKYYVYLDDKTAQEKRYILLGLLIYY